MKSLCIHILFKLKFPMWVDNAPHKNHRLPNKNLNIRHENFPSELVKVIQEIDYNSNIEYFCCLWLPPRG